MAPPSRSGAAATRRRRRASDEPDAPTLALQVETHLRDRGFAAAVEVRDGSVAVTPSASGELDRWAIAASLVMAGFDAVPRGDLVVVVGEHRARLADRG